jgi:hypothetical protein
MSKLIFMVMILFTVSTKAQDTTYYQQRNHFYMTVRTQINDSTMVLKFVPQLTKKQKRNNTIFTVVTGIVFTGLTAWFWWK